jgi:signal transduction histidine kinase
MRGRARLTFWVFVVSTLLVVDVLAWAGWRMLALEQRNNEQQVVRLALWRMDSIVTPIIASEAARPYFHYLAAYPTNRSYGRMLEPGGPNDILLPSPLLESALTDDLIKLHYQVWPTGEVTSPQVLRESEMDNLGGVAVPMARQMFSNDRLEEFSTVVGVDGPSADSLSALASADADTPDEAELRERNEAPAPSETLDQEYAARQQVAVEAQKRSAALNNANAPMSKGEPSFLEDSVGAAGGMGRRGDAEAAPTWGVEAPGPSVEVGRFFAVWRESDAGTPQLVLERTVTVGDERYVQGAWIDWPVLQQRLIGAVGDLLPNATLAPAEHPAGRPTESMLATIPVRLEPGAIAPTHAGLFGSPARFTLMVTALAVGAAIVAIGFVLRASVVNAERRGQFVTAVTHELRTPLTTFRLYSQMLADGMVGDEAKRTRYLGTLKSESERLAKIVENVLDYARLGGSPTKAIGGTVDADALFAQVVPTLEARADAGGFELVADISPIGATVRASPETVERILSNLVDNALKYAGAADDKRLHLSARPAGGGVEVTFRDHGPGIPAGDRSRVFGAFQRARRDADGPNPGLGLGLALSRGMARQMGGDLRLVDHPEPGAAFVLTLPGG